MLSLPCSMLLCVSGAEFSETFLTIYFHRYFLILSTNIMVNSKSMGNHGQGKKNGDLLQFSKERSLLNWGTEYTH